MSRFQFRFLAQVKELMPILRLARAAATLMLVCALLVAAAPHTFAQTVRGTILGAVTDPQGAVVVGAAVAARNLDTGVERTSMSGGAGDCSSPELPIGRYEVRGHATGFQPYS